MNALGSPLQLHIYLQMVVKHYRATPHTSTEQTPYELIVNAPIPVMFPQLVDTQRKLQEVHRHSIPKHKYGHQRKFNIGDIVLVYDNVSKLNDYGIIKLVKSNNSYVIDIDGVNKHISGDNLSIIQKVKDIINNNNDNTSEDIVDTNEDKGIIDNDDNMSDTESISEKSEFEFPSSGNTNVNLNVHSTRRRKYRSELDNLQVGFPLPASKTRSGHI